MKVASAMLIVVMALLYGTPVTWAQEGWPGCPWGYSYDPMVHGYQWDCLHGRTFAAEITASGSGAVAHAFQGEQETPPEGWPGCPWGYSYDPMVHGYQWDCLHGRTSVSGSFAAKPAGLAQTAPATQGWPGCPWGYSYDPMVHGYQWDCLHGRTPN